MTQKPSVHMYLLIACSFIISILAVLPALAVNNSMMDYDQLEDSVPQKQMQAKTRLQPGQTVVLTPFTFSTATKELLLPEERRALEENFLAYLSVLLQNKQLVVDTISTISPTAESSQHTSQASPTRAKGTTVKKPPIFDENSRRAPASYLIPPKLTHQQEPASRLNEHTTATIGGDLHIEQETQSIQKTKQHKQLVVYAKIQTNYTLLQERLGSKPVIIHATAQSAASLRTRYANSNEQNKQLLFLCLEKNLQSLAHSIVEQLTATP